jgi:hypothetical protein
VSLIITDSIQMQSRTNPTGHFSPGDIFPLYTGIYENTFYYKQRLQHRSLGVHALLANHDVDSRDQHHGCRYNIYMKLLPDKIVLREEAEAGHFNNRRPLN